MKGKNQSFFVFTLVISLVGAGFLMACQQKTEDTGPAPEAVIGQVELPGLQDEANSGAGLQEPDTDTAEASENRASNRSVPEEIETQLPDFTKYTNVEEKKKAFFDFLRPIVRKENHAVLKQRALVLLKWKRFQQGQKLSETEIARLNGFAEKYRVEAAYDQGEKFFRQLLIHMDKIPVSLALIQAAKESGWGTSYFAREGNNLFGHWCFETGCGIIPRQRPAGATYEVRAFDNVAESVRAYIRNLNSHPAYRELRIQRYRMRLAGKQPDAHLMAGGLEKYSGIGMKYVDTVRQMIRGNEKFMGIHEPLAP
mgnify:CR=1 FL=1